MSKMKNKFFRISGVHFQVRDVIIRKLLYVTGSVISSSLLSFFPPYSAACHLDNSHRLLLLRCPFYFLIADGLPCKILPGSLFILSSLSLSAGISITMPIMRCVAFRGGRGSPPELLHHNKQTHTHGSGAAKCTLTDLIDSVSSALVLLRRFLHGRGFYFSSAADETRLRLRPSLFS